MYSENFVSKKLKTFAQKNDWLVSGEYIYGEEQGYLFTGMDSKGQKTFITPVPGITDEQKAELFEVLAKNKQTMKLEKNVRISGLEIFEKSSIRSRTLNTRRKLSILGRLSVSTECSHFDKKFRKNKKFQNFLRQNHA